MFKTTFCDTYDTQGVVYDNPCREVLLDATSEAPESPSGASQPDPNPEQGSEKVRGIPFVPAVLRVWAPDNQLLGACKIETFAKGDGSHYFRVPARIILNPGVRVEIEVDIE